jgi:hypothetical protein
MQDIIKRGKSWQKESKRKDCGGETRSEIFSSLDPCDSEILVTLEWGHWSIQCGYTEAGKRWNGDTGAYNVDTLKLGSVGMGTLEHAMWIQ